MQRLQWSAAAGMVSLTEGATAGEARAQGEARTRDGNNIIIIIIYIIHYYGDGWRAAQTGSLGTLSRAGQCHPTGDPSRWLSMNSLREGMGQWRSCLTSSKCLVGLGGYRLTI